jgi:hypothetical protein
MINNNDRMSDNLSFSLDRIVRRLEDQSVDESLQHLHLQPDQPGSVFMFVCVRTYPDFLCQIFQVKYQVMKSYFVINDQTLE